MSYSLQIPRLVSLKSILLILILISLSLIPQTSSAQSWARSLGGTGIDRAFSVATDQEGNVYSTGFFSNTADFDPGEGEVNLTSAGDYDVYVLKWSPSGELIWAFSFGADARDFGLAISLDGDGNVICAGNYGSTVDFDPGPDTFELSSAGGSRDIFVLKLNSQGEFIWAESLGGAAQEDGRCMTTDEFGNIYISGLFQGVTDMDPGEEDFNLSSSGGQDVFITKLDSNGDFVWSKQMSGTGNERGFAIDVDPFENVYLTGQFNGTVDFDPGVANYDLTSSAHDAFIAKLNVDGDFEWAKQIGGIQDDQGQGIAVNDAGEVYALGNFQNTVDIDPGVDEEIVSSAGSYDSFVLKLDAAGETIWTQTFGGASVELSRSLVLDSDENVYISGQFANFTDLDPGEEVFELISNGSYDSFVSMLNSDGVFQWGIHMGGPGADDSKSVAVDNGGNVYSGGGFLGTADFDPSEGTYNLSVAGAEDFYIHRYSQVECAGAPELTLSMELAEQNDTVCAGTETPLDFYLEVNYFDFPGLSYQWQYNSGDEWTDFEDSLGTTYSTISPDISTDYRVITTCESGNDSHTSNVISVVVESSPEVSITPSDIAVCTGGEVELTATGAQEYSWSPGTDLSGTTGSTVTSTPTAQRIYTVTGTNDNGCSNTATTTVTPISELDFSVSTSPTNVCEAGTPVTLNVSNLPEEVSGGSLEFQWLNEEMSVVQDWSPSSTFVFTPTEEGQYNYLVNIRSSICPAEVQTRDAIVVIGFSADVEATHTVCNSSEGSFALSNIVGQFATETFYSNDFSSPVDGEEGVETFLTAQVNDGRMVLTESQGNVKGGFYLDPEENEINWANAAYEVSFLLSADQLFNGGGNAFAYSFGDDVQFTNIGNLGHGLGSKLRLVFDPTDSPGANPTPNFSGVYLVYGLQQNGQQVGLTSDAFVAYEPNTASWLNATDIPVNIRITLDGKATVKIDGTTIFDQVPLPDEYINADKSAWAHLFTANTPGNGSSGNRFAIDNLDISYKGIELGITNEPNEESPEEWQQTHVFEGLAPGSYNIWVRNPSDLACNQLIGTYQIENSDLEVGATILSIEGDGSLCPGSNILIELSLENGYEEFAGIEYQWQINTGDGWEDIAGANQATYSTSSSNETASYRAVVSCSTGNGSDTSEQVDVEVTTNAELSITPTYAAVCSGEEIVLTATGAQEYSWSPAIDLNETTGATVVSTPTEQRNYLVTGTDDNGCTSTATVTVLPISDVTISTSVSPSSICEPGQGVTLDVSNIPEGMAGEENWEFQWSNEDMDVVQDWSPASQYTFIPQEVGQYTYLVNMRNTNCLEQEIGNTGQARVDVGFGATVNPLEIDCATGGGAFLTNIFGQSGSEVSYFNDFSIPLDGEEGVELFSSAQVSDGRMVLTESELSLEGIFSVYPVANSAYWPNAAYEISFLMTADQAVNNGGAALAYSFGDDADAGAPGPVGHGRGSKLRLVFDSQDNSNNSEGNLEGIYLRYGYFDYGQVGPDSETVIGYSSNLSWRNATDVAVKVDISLDGKVTVTLGNTIIFDSIQLPDEYLQADQSTWVHTFGARTAGPGANRTLRHAIDDLEIKLAGLEFGITDAQTGAAPVEWQNDNYFEELQAGSYNVWMANPSNYSCNQTVGTITLEPNPECVDCPELMANIGDSCDDGNENTTDDLITEDCTCEGTTPAECPGDFDENGVISSGDLLILLAEFGCLSACETDLDGDDAVSISDLLNFLSLFGTTCDASGDGQ